MFILNEWQFVFEISAKSFDYTPHSAGADKRIRSSSADNFSSQLRYIECTKLNSTEGESAECTHAIDSKILITEVAIGIAIAAGRKVRK